MKPEKDMKGRPDRKEKKIFIEMIYRDGTFLPDALTREKKSNDLVGGTGNFSESGKRLDKHQFIIR